MNFDQQQLMLQVADAIEDDPASYAQEHWVDHTYCGTRCCIAGWAVKIAEPERFNIDFRNQCEVRNLSEYIELNAHELLGLASNKALLLFHSGWKPVEDMTVSEALRKIAGGSKLSEVTQGSLAYTAERIGW